MWLQYISKILLYALICLVFFYGAKRSGNSEVWFHWGVIGINRETTNCRITLGWGVLFCICEAFYSIICGPGGQYIYDREVFAEHYVLGAIYKSSSIGLYYIQIWLKTLTNDPIWLFVSVALLFMFVNICAYNKYEAALPFTFVYLVSSQYFLYGCYQLKQALAAAFAALSIAYFFKKEKWTCILFLSIAICFHESSWILIPLYIAMLGARNKWVSYFEYLILFVCLVFFRQISGVVISIFTMFVPSLSGQLHAYMSDDSLVLSGNIMTALKGLPLYLITFWGITSRKHAKSSIPSYDKYLMISVFASITTMMSSYMAWMWRFAELVYFPVFVFAAQLRNNTDDRNKLFYDVLIVGGLLFFTFRKLVMSYFIYGGLV